MTRAPKWLMFLPQVLMRTSTNGGAACRGQIAKRFNALVSQDWGKLFTLLLNDSARMDNRQDGELGPGTWRRSQKGLLGSAGRADDPRVDGSP